MPGKSATVMECKTERLTHTICSKITKGTGLNPKRGFQWINTLFYISTLVTNMSADMTHRRDDACLQTMSTVVQIRRKTHTHTPEQQLWAADRLLRSDYDSIV